MREVQSARRKSMKGAKSNPPHGYSKSSVLSTILELLGLLRGPHGSYRKVVNCPAHFYCIRHDMWQRLLKKWSRINFQSAG